MSVARVTEITAGSNSGFKEAIEEGLKRAGKTLDNIEGAWVKDMKVRCKNGKIDEYRVTLKVTFVLR